jgi:hypothetical protein
MIIAIGAINNASA